MKKTPAGFAVAAFVFLGFSGLFLFPEIHADCVALPPGMVAWYRAENDASDSTLRHPGTLKNGAAFAAGLVGQAFSFDGVDDVVEVPDSPELNPETISLEAWVKPVVIKPSARIVAKELAENSCTPPYLVWSLDVRDDLGKHAAFFLTVGGSSSYVAGTTVIPTNVFTHLAATFDGTIARIYVNGVAEGAVTANGTLSSSTAPVLIGAPSVATSSCFPNRGEFEGLIDEVTIYDRALSAAEVQALFNAGTAGKCPQPRLQIHVTGGSAVLFWSPAIPGFVLEQATSLPAVSWQPGPTGNPTAAFPVGNLTRFYRLRKP